jgi:hypothetical protein
MKKSAAILLGVNFLLYTTSVDDTHPKVDLVYTDANFEKKKKNCPIFLQIDH